MLFLKNSLKLGCIALLLAPPLSAHAHPHILIDAEVHFMVSRNDDNIYQLNSLAYKWQFDENFSMLLVGDYDDDQNQLLNQQELTTMGIETMEGAKELGYFTYLANGNQAIKPADAPEVLASFSDNRLTLDFNLSLEKPIILNSNFKFKLFDDEYYTAFILQQKTGYQIIGTGVENCAIKQIQGEVDNNLETALQNAFNDDTTNQGMGAQFADEMSIKCE